MKNSLHSICDRLREGKKYMNSRAILLVDIFLSAGSSFVTLLFVDNFIIDLSRSTYVLSLIHIFWIVIGVVVILGGLAVLMRKRRRNRM